LGENHGTITLGKKERGLGKFEGAAKKEVDFKTSAGKNGGDREGTGSEN